jgi:hypothetical protein
VDGRRLSIAPAEIAMTLDVDATVGAAMKGAPTLLGERTVPPVIRLDQARLEAVLRRNPGRGAVTLDLDPQSAAAAVRKAWLTAGTATIDLS